MATMPAATSIFCPNINSFRRMVGFAAAPTVASWGEDDKSAAVRVLSRSPKAARIESRVAGGDANPYLVLAAVLAGGIAGIEQCHRTAAATRCRRMGAARRDTRICPTPSPRQPTRWRPTRSLRSVLGVRLLRVLGQHPPLGMADVPHHRRRPDGDQRHAVGARPSLRDRLTCLRRLAPFGSASPPTSRWSCPMRRRRIAALRRQRAVREGGAQGRRDRRCCCPSSNPTTPRRCSSMVDALIITGGGDVDPGQLQRPGRPACSARRTRTRDAADLAITRAAVDANVPTLATCRGHPGAQRRDGRHAGAARRRPHARRHVQRRCARRRHRPGVASRHDPRHRRRWASTRCTTR